MKFRILPNGLSIRVNRCLAKAGIPIDKQVIVSALKSGKLYAHCWPPNYGKYAHRDVCLWAGVDRATLSTNWPDTDKTIFPNIGISYRAWRCLRRSDIPRIKKAVRRALQAGKLSPGKCPSNYGPVTHAELCRWVGIDPKTLLSVRRIARRKG
jgi:hypothetical protein